MAYRLEYRASVKNELRKLSQIDRTVVIGKIEQLKNEPKPVGSANLKGSSNLFRIRHGDYQVIYQIKKEILVIIVIRIGHRREIYKKL